MELNKFKIGREYFVMRMYQEGDENVLIPMANKIGNMSRDLKFWDWKHKKILMDFLL